MEKGMEQGGQESDHPENALKTQQEEAGEGDNAEQLQGEGAESNRQEDAVEEENQQIEGRKQENAPNPDDLIPEDNELLKSLPLKRKNRGSLSRNEYASLIEFVKEELHPGIHAQSIVKRREMLRKIFRAARGSPVFEVSRRIWQQGITPMTGVERRDQENVQEERRGRADAFDQENAQKQEEGQEGNDFPADIHLLETLLEYLKRPDNEAYFSKEDDYQVFLFGFVSDCYPRGDAIGLVTRILELKENFLARARIWSVSPGRLTDGAGPSSSMSDQERRALKDRVREAIEKAKRNNFQMTDLEMSNVAVCLDSLFTPSSGLEEDVGIVTVPKRPWSEITEILQARSYSAPRNRTNAERNLEKGQQPIHQSIEYDAKGKQFIEQSSEDVEEMSKKPDNVELPRLIALADDLLDSLNIREEENQDELDEVHGSGSKGGEEDDEHDCEAPERKVEEFNILQNLQHLPDDLVRHTASKLDLETKIILSYTREFKWLLSVRELGLDLKQWDFLERGNVYYKYEEGYLYLFFKESHPRTLKFLCRFQVQDDTKNWTVSWKDDPARFGVKNFKGLVIYGPRGRRYIY